MNNIEWKESHEYRAADRCDRLKEPVLPIPVNPVVYASLRAIYGGDKGCWTSDMYGRPLYHYQSRDGQITVFYELPATGYLPWNEPTKGLPTFHRHFLSPRWGFIYAGRLRAAISRFSVETADVFLILMARIARLPDPKHDTARIRLEEIADHRGVRVRHGSSRKLHEDLKQEVLRLADLRLAMEWRDYKNGRSVVFGRERPDRLLDIVDLEYKQDGKSITAFGFRCGQALAHFLNPDGLRWVGYYSQAILQLSPYHEAFTKKLGTFWTMVGITAGKKGMYPQASPRTILDFCGEQINWRNPGQMVDAFIEAHNRLIEIGVIDLPPVLEPSNRRRGYFLKWLDTPLTVRLSKAIWQVDLTARKNRRLLTAHSKPPGLKKPLEIPQTPRELQKEPHTIRQFRGLYGIHQAELARAVGVTRQTLSKYDRVVTPLPEEKASRLIRIIQSKTRQSASRPI